VSANRHLKWISVFAVCFNYSAIAEVEFSGYAGIEFRWFPDNPQFVDQHHGAQNSLIFEPEFLIENDEHQFSFIPFARLDSRDDERSHADIREAYWLYIQNDWELLIGANREFWGVTESRHLVNIQIDFEQNNPILHCAPVLKIR